MTASSSPPKATSRSILRCDGSMDMDAHIDDRHLNGAVEAAVVGAKLGALHGNEDKQMAPALAPEPSGQSFDRITTRAQLEQGIIDGKGMLP